MRKQVRLGTSLGSFWLFGLVLACFAGIGPVSAQIGPPVPPPVRGGFNDPAIQELWYRTDSPALLDRARTYIWGPNVIRKWQEPYRELTGGSRVVVYFDKGRMDINNPDAPRTAPNYLSSGPLVRELLSGQAATGGISFEPRNPPDNITIVGDDFGVNTTAPTYAALSKVASVRGDNAATARPGEAVIQTLNAQGQVSPGPDTARYNVKLTDFDALTQHNVADVFSRFFAQEGPVIENGNLRQARPIDAPALVGSPLTEPFWVRSRVAGVEKDVLVQAFENRLLTYTADNPAAYQVEMGNVGRHYYQWRYGSNGFPFQNSEVGPNGAVVTSANPYATQAGLAILADGGNAIDAAVGVMFALGVVEPQSSGIGGGGFMMIRLKSGESVVVDTREVAPASATKEMFLDSAGQPLAFGPASTSGKAVGVPGAVKGADEVLKRFGSVSLAMALAPAIRLAEDGFITTPRFAEVLGDTASQSKLKLSPAAASLLLPNGQPIRAGTLLRQPDLAKTYQLIASSGPNAFYNDTELSRAILQAVNERGGNMTADDLRRYEVKYRQPLRDTYRGYEIIAMPPPSSGGLTMLQILKLLEPYDLRGMGQNSADHLHLLSEATRLAFADRARYMGDEDFVRIPKTGLLDKRYLDQRRTLLKLETANRQVQAGDPTQFDSAAVPTSFAPSLQPQMDGRETSHLVVADRDGNIVSFTNTIESAYGTGILVPGWGFLLNNELTDFDFRPGGPNEVAPNKRPRSSMNSAIVLNQGQPYLAVGSPGGATIILSVTEVIMNMIDFGMNVQDAIDAPRTYGPTFPAISWEVGVAPAVRAELVRRGHTFAPNPAFIGSIQAVAFRPDGSKTGGADWRRDGMVLGLPKY